MKRLAGELFVIVIGVLIALGVDEWRQDREELRIANEHLSGIAAELRQNLCTAERVRVRMLGRKLENLQVVLQFLGDPEAPVSDPAALLQAFARSTAAARPWMVDNEFQALQNSGDVRLVRKLQPNLNLSTLYEAPDVLFSQVERIQGPYPVVVNELIPAQLQTGFSQLSGYTPDQHAPALADDADLTQAIERIRARRGELLALARNEAAVATGRWYALTRIKADLEAKLVELAAWDHDPTPIAELTKTCTEPRTRR